MDESAGTDGDDSASGDESAGLPETEVSDVDTIPCPECGEPLPDGARFCPHCRTDLTEDGSAVDLSALDGLGGEFESDLLDDDERRSLLETDAAGRRRASRPIRIVAGLAVSIPLAPLVLYLTSAVVDLTVWTGGLVFLAGWLLPAAFLARARLPAEAFGRSLYLIGIGTSLVPVALVFHGRVSPGLNNEFGALTALALVITVVAFALGNFVTSQARQRVDGETRFFEEHREE